MTNEQINTAIAEALGYSDIGPRELEEVDIESRSVCYWHGVMGKKDGAFRPVPDFCSDLNVMHTVVELLLDDIQRFDFADHLQRIAGNTRIQMIQATAHQRSEAFLRVIGKWKDAAKEVK